MPQTAKVLKPSFSGGEFAPSLYARVDLQRYHSGCMTLRNFIVHPHGGASNRPGLQYIAKPRYSAKKSRGVGFEFSTEQVYSIEFGEYYCRFYKNDANGKAGQISILAADATDFNPVTSYTTDGVNYVKVGPYISLNCGGTKRLHVSAPYGESVTGKTVAVEIAAGDALAVTYVAGAITISLANTTPAKNSADLIQAALRSADASTADWYVTENAAYAAARPTAGVTLTATALTANAKIYTCILASAGTATNTNRFPPAETTYWTDQIIYEIVTPYKEADLSSLKFTQSADVLYITHNNYHPKTLTRYSHINWKLEDYAFEDGPFMKENATVTTIDPSATTGSITLTATTAIFDILHIGALFKLTHYIGGSAYNGAFTGTANGTSLNCGGTWRIITHGTWTGKIKIEKSTDGGSTWIIIREFSGVNDNNINTYGTEDEDKPFLIRVSCHAFTSGTIYADLTTDAFEQSGVVKITDVTAGGLKTSATALVLIDMGSHAATADWCEGAWSDYRGWPATATFYQDRLEFAATKYQPQDTWSTKTSNYVNFGKSIPLIDSDGISISLPSRKVNAIRHLIPLAQILAFTSSSEWTIGPGSNSAFTPTTASQKFQGTRGCSIVVPIVIGNRVVFIQPKGSIVRDLIYTWASDSFDGDPLSLLSAHLFENHQIIDMAYQAEPDSIVWCIRNDGILLSMTYMREQEVIAWAWHDTDGEFESVWTIPGETYDEVWFVIKRGTERYIERMVQRMVSTNPKDQLFIDCGISYDSPLTITGISKETQGIVTATSHGFTDGDLVDIEDVVGVLDATGVSLVNGIRFKVSDATTHTFKLKDPDTNLYINTSTATVYSSGGEARKAITAITDLNHLEGRTVVVLADGSVVNGLVVTGNSITLPVAAGRAHIGLGFYSDLQTLNLELNLLTGTTQGRLLKVPSVQFRFLNSSGGWIGPDVNHLDQIVLRTDEPMGSPEALYSGFHRQPIAGDYAEGGRVFFRQKDPLPVTILAVIPEVAVGG